MYTRGIPIIKNTITNIDYDNNNLSFLEKLEGMKYENFNSFEKATNFVGAGIVTDEHNNILYLNDNFQLNFNRNNQQEINLIDADEKNSYFVTDYFGKKDFTNLTICSRFINKSWPFFNSFVGVNEFGFYIVSKIDNKASCLEEFRLLLDTDIQFEPRTFYEALYLNKTNQYDKIINEAKNFFYGALFENLIKTKLLANSK